MKRRSFFFGAVAVLLSCLSVMAAVGTLGGRQPAAVVNMGGGPQMLERSLFSTNTPTLPFSQWYTVPGSGSPALSTSDYYSMNGWYWSIPYDLDTMGAEGAAVKAREGKRFVWILCGDHPVNANFANSSDFFVGYSNDPQVFPDPSTLRVLFHRGRSINVVDQNGQTQNGLSIYEGPFLVYNPDSAGDKFYIYAEASSGGHQHELTLLTTPDFLSSTLVGPAIPTTTFAGWSSFGQPRRLGVNNWEVYTFGKPDGSGGSAATPKTYKYTSTDGWVWTSTFTPIADGFGPFLTIAGQASLLSGDRPGGSEYLAYWPVNANKQRIGAATHISTAFEDQNLAYPWQTLLQDVQAYEEDGVASIYITRGFPTSHHDRTNSGPYLGNVPHLMPIQGSIAPTTGNNGLLTTTSPPPYPVVIGFRLLNSAGGNLANSPEVTSDNGDGTYNIKGLGGPPPTDAGPFLMPRNGGLWHNFVDQYYLITDATAAASAAPLGVKASCAGGVATVQWNNSLPHQNYRVYQGTSAASQPTLVGDVTGTSTSFAPPADQQTWIKVVTMNVTEQKSRVVDTYCSANSAMVNKHVTRVINDGGDITKIDFAFLVSVDAYLSTNDYYKYLIHWADARFGVKFDGSGFISKVYCLGTTRMPKYGDYTPTTSNTFPSTSSNTSYSATSFRGTTPSWINNASTARGYFGNGRGNLIQRKNEITLIAAYQRPSNTGFLSMFGNGSGTGFYLGQAGSASGNVTFALSPDWTTTYTTATVPFASGTAAHVAAGIFDGINITAVLDGVAGTPVSLSAANNPTMEKNTVLRGLYTDNTGSVPVLASGSQETRWDIAYSGSTENVSYNFPFSQSLSTYAALIAFEKGSAQIVSDITAMYQ